MVYSSPVTVTLLAQDDSDWLDRLTARLNQFDCRFSLVKTVDEAWQVLENQPVDALLALAESTENLNLFRAISQTLPAPDRPLLILICDPSYNYAQTQDADLVLTPGQIDFIEHHLKTLLKWRAANTYLETQNRALAEENGRLKEELEVQKRADRDINLLKSAIVRNVSHELKTPLLQVKSAVALLAQGPGDEEKLLQYATDATARLEAAVRNITLLNELLNESSDTYPTSVVIVRDLIDYALRNLRRSWEHKNQIDRVKITIPAHIAPILGDKQSLGIALQLLIDNALKFSQRDVLLTARQEGSQVFLTVQDWGIGIASDKVKHIFDSFYQIDPSSTRRHGGMGVGLAIVRVILERHKTQARVESELGKGSTFWFALPIAEIRP